MYVCMYIQRRLCSADMLSPTVWRSDEDLCGTDYASLQILVLSADLSFRFGQCFLIAKHDFSMYLQLFIRIISNQAATKLRTRLKV